MDHSLTCEIKSIWSGGHQSYPYFGDSSGKEEEKKEKKSWSGDNGNQKKTLSLLLNTFCFCFSIYLPGFSLPRPEVEAVMSAPVAAEREHPLKVAFLPMGSWGPTSGPLSWGPLTWDHVQSHTSLNALLKNDFIGDVTDIWYVVHVQSVQCANFWHVYIPSTLLPQLRFWTHLSPPKVYSCLW